MVGPAPFKVAETRIDELRRRLERDPGSRLFAQLAEEHRKAGDHAEAIRVSRAGLALHPAYPSARLTLGRALLDAGDAAAARVELTQVLREAPDNILASRFLAHAAELAGDLPAALQQYSATLRMAPADPQIEAQIAALRARIGQTRTAPPALPSPAAPHPSERGSSSPPPLPGRQGAAPPPVAGPPPIPRAAVETSGRADGPGAAEPLRRPHLVDPPPPVPSRPVAAKPIVAEEYPLEPTIRMQKLPDIPASGVAEGHPPIASAAPVAAPAAAGATAIVPPSPIAAEPEAAPPLDDPFERLASPEPSAAAADVEPLSSSTLAELYLRQGMIDRAREVYLQVLAEDPANERALAGLRGIEATRAVPSDPRAGRRAALERTIAGLEAMLAAVRRS
jgi:tetratricopeptide (TPR) repeat protein